MKRRFLMALSAFGLMLALPAGAHIRQGTTVVQGNASLSSSSGALYSNETVTSFALSPSVRYFVIDQLAVGGQMNLDYLSQGPFHNTNFALGPSAAYYFGGLDSKTIPYAGTSLLVRTLSDGSSHSENGTTVSLFGGMAAFLSEHLAVTPEVAVNLESLGGSAGTTVQVGVGLAGFLYNPVYRGNPRAH